jgi:hypothetical protein
MAVLSHQGLKGTALHNAEIYIRPAVENEVMLFALKIRKYHYRTAEFFLHKFFNGP